MRPGKFPILETPTGIVAVTPLRLRPVAELMHGPALLLADLNDPGNAGTLLRSAEAFGASGVVFGSLGVDPFHPKVVRGAMGALFRLPLASATPEELASAARAAGIPIFGLAMGGEAVASISFPPDFVLSRRARAPRLGALGRPLHAARGHSDARAGRESERRRSGLDRPLRGDARAALRS